MAGADPRADLLARIRDAANPQGHGHSIDLTRLVDGEATYTAKCCGQTKEFPDMDEAWDWVRQVKAAASEGNLLAALEEYVAMALFGVITISPVGNYDFARWSNTGLAGQCLMQAREQLDPEFTAFMVELSKRLDGLPANPAPGPKNPPFTPNRVS